MIFFFPVLFIYFFFFSLLFRSWRLLFLLALQVAVLVNSRQLSIITIRDHWIPNQWSLMVACRSCPPTVTGKERLSHFCHVEFQPWTCITYLTYLEMITYLILSTLAFGSGLHRERHGNVKTVMAIASTAKTYLTYLTIPATWSASK